MAEYHRGPAPGTVLLFSPERDVRHLGFCFAFYSPCAKIELNGPINLLRLDCAEPQVLYPPPCTIDTLRGVGKAAELEFAYESQELREICEKQARAKDELGDTIADMLRHRLADIDAASNPNELVAGNPRLSNAQDSMVVDLCDGYKIVFAPNHANNPMTPQGALDWKRVRSVKILRIERDDVYCSSILP